MAASQHRDFARADEVRDFPNGQASFLHFGDGEVGRLVLQPGWRWSEHIKPMAGTELCEAPHFQYHQAGTLHVEMADGSSFDVTPGEVSFIPPGHDAWVVGDEPVVIVDWSGAEKYETVLAGKGT